jgi:uncharacterized protein YjiS (DUF1127 family)
MMTIEHFREFAPVPVFRPQAVEPAAPAHALARLLRWVKALALRRAANRMLRRAVRRPQRIYLDEMPEYLLKDLGLPPDYR